MNPLSTILRLVAGRKGAAIACLTLAALGSSVSMAIPATAAPLADASDLSISAPLSISNVNPFLGQPVTAAFKIRNNSTQAVTIQEMTAAARFGSDWNGTNVDFPHIWTVTIPGGGEYAYNRDRTFTALGDYFAEPRIKVNNTWSAVAGGNRVNFTTRPPVTSSPVVLTPPNPATGQTVRAQFTITNATTFMTVAVQELTAAVRLSSAPNGTPYDFPHVWSINLPPGGTYNYDKSRTFNTAGDYFHEVRVKLNGVWIPITSRVNFTITPPSPGKLHVTSAIDIAPDSPFAGDSASATFKVKNVGGQPVTVQGLVASVLGPGGASANFPEDVGFTLQPNQERTYRKSRTFTTAGGYTAEPKQKIGGNWVNIEGGTQTPFTVQAASPPWPKVTTQLALTKASPPLYDIRAGETVTATFTIQNVGSKPLAIQELTAGARLGDDWDDTNVDFPHVWSINLQPGQSYSYQKQRSFTTAGNYFVQPRARFNNTWVTIDDGDRINFQLRVMALIPVGQKPTGIAVNPTNNRIYVTNSDSNTVSVIDGNYNRIVATLPVGTHPVDVAVNPSTKRVYVANSDDSTVSVIDGNTNRVIATFVAMHNPTAIAVNPTWNHVFVGNSGGDASDLSVYDGATYDLVWMERVAQDPFDIAVNTANNRIYVSFGSSDSFGVWQDAAGGISVVTSVSPADYPKGIGVNPDTGRIYWLSGTLVGDLRIFDGTSHEMLEIWRIAPSPTFIALNPALSRMYVTHTYDDPGYLSLGSLSDPNSGPNIYFGVEPLGVAVNTSTKRVYVACSGSNYVAVLQDY